MALPEAARYGDAAEVARLLAAGAAVDETDDTGSAALHHASMYGYVHIMRLLLEAGASPMAAGRHGCLPLHLVRASGSVSADEEAVRLLLEAAPAAAMVANRFDQLPLHCAVHVSNLPAVQALLQAAPQAALVKSRGSTPLGHAVSGAIFYRNYTGQPQSKLAIARTLLPAMPTAAVLEDLTRFNDMASHWEHPAFPGFNPVFGDVAASHPLFVDLAATSALNPEQWQRFPASCTGLLRALPATLRRSEAEAALLVVHLPSSDWKQLRAALRCLHRAQRRAGVSLPTPLVWRILALALADQA